MSPLISSRLDAFGWLTTCFVARIEPDPDHPDNHAHANVYNSVTSGTGRKKMAQRLVQAIVDAAGVLVPPSFA